MNTMRKNLDEAYAQLRKELNQPRNDEKGAEKLTAMEDADPAVTAMVAHVVSRFMRSEPLPK